LPLTAVAVASTATAARRARYAANTHEVPRELCDVWPPRRQATTAGGLGGRAHPPLRQPGRRGAAAKSRFAAVHHCATRERGLGGRTTPLFIACQSTYPDRGRPGRPM